MTEEEAEKHGRAVTRLMIEHVGPMAREALNAYLAAARDAHAERWHARGTPPPFALTPEMVVDMITIGSVGAATGALCLHVDALRLLDLRPRPAAEGEAPR